MTDVDPKYLRVVVTVKLAVMLPPATVTLAGTLAAELLLLDKATTTPPLGAGPLSVTFPVDGLPPTTVAGVSETDANVTLERFTVRVEDF